MNYGQGRSLAPRPLGPPPLLEPPPDENKKRKRAAIACKPCRERKSACNSVRPVCAACEARQTECYYLTKDESETKLQALRRENNTLNELIHHLRIMPVDAAQSILQGLRNSANPESILKDIKDGKLLTVQPSQRETALAALPPVYSETEFNLMVDHPAAYPPLDLTHDAMLAKSTLLDSIRGLTHARPTESASGIPTASASSSRTLSDDPQDILSAQAEPNVLTDGLFPGDIEPTLEDLRIQYWTTVDVTDEFAASAISQYLENDHPTLGLFDAQLFVKDLVQRRHECCSSFLVTALLAFACQAYTSKDPDAAAKSFEFEKEADVLRRAEKEDSVLTTAGLSLLFLSHGGHGSGREMELLHEASDMAKRIKLYGVKTVLDEEQISSLSPAAQRALSHTAWGVFNLHILQAQYYLTLSTEYEPKVPIPRESGNRESEGDIPQLKLLHSQDAGQVFHYLCRLSVLASGILLVVRDTTGSKTPPPLAFAMQQYRQLLELVDSLPPEMQRKAGADYAPVLDFHIALHSLITDLFRPFITRERDDGFREFYQKHNSPEAIFASSIHQLKGIVVEYTSQHPSAAHHMYWATALLYVFNTIVKDRSDPYWRFYFWLCIHCYSQLFICYPVVEGVVQSLLAIAVKYGAISRKDATRVMQEGFYKDDAGRRARSRRGRPGEKYKGSYKFDLDLAVRDRDASDVSALIARFEDMDMFDEFTRLGESESSEDGNDVRKESQAVSRSRSGRMSSLLYNVQLQYTFNSIYIQMKPISKSCTGLLAVFRMRSYLLHSHFPVFHYHLHMYHRSVNCTIAISGFPRPSKPPRSCTFGHQKCAHAYSSPFIHTRIIIAIVPRSPSFILISPIPIPPHLRLKPVHPRFCPPSTIIIRSHDRLLILSLIVVVRPP